jgi:anhydro-N-acetylmuramic acid kinase
LGLEWVQENFQPLIVNYKDVDLKDVLRTLVEHIAFQITSCIEDNKVVLITGGGAYNSFLISRICQTKKVRVVLPSESIIEFKEALIFAFLGILKLRGEINCLSSVTGALKNHSSGVVYPSSEVYN